MSEEDRIDVRDEPSWTHAALYDAAGEVVAMIPIGSPPPDALEYEGLAYLNTGTGTGSTGGNVLRYDPRD